MESRITRFGKGSSAVPARAVSNPASIWRQDAGLGRFVSRHQLLQLLSCSFCSIAPRAAALLLHILTATQSRSMPSFSPSYSARPHGTVSAASRYHHATARSNSFRRPSSRPCPTPIHPFCSAGAPFGAANFLPCKNRQHRDTPQRQQDGPLHRETPRPATSANTLNDRAPMPVLLYFATANTCCACSRTYYRDCIQTGRRSRHSTASFARHPEASFAFSFGPYPVLHWPPSIAPQ